MADSELHSGLPARPIIIGTLEEGYFHWPPILLHSLPMDTDAIIRLLCGIFLDGFAGQTSFHRNGWDLLWDTILGVQHSYVGISLLDAVGMIFIDFECCPYGRLQTLQLFQIIDNGRTGLVRVRY